MNILTNRRLASLDKSVRTILPDVCRIDYDPAFPRPRGEGTFAWYQVIFAVGPGEDDEVRSRTISLIEELFDIFLKNKLFKYADSISLRARRRRNNENPDWSNMYFEVTWLSINLRRTTQGHWHELAWMCVNRWNDKDSLNKIPEA